MPGEKDTGAWPAEARIASFGGPEWAPAVLAGFDGKILTLTAPAAFPLLGPVKVESSNELFMGAVIACKASAAGFDLQIEVEETLKNLAAIERISARFQSESDRPDRPQSLERETDRPDRAVKPA